MHYWDAPRDEPGMISHEPWVTLLEPKPEAFALQAISTNLAMSAAVKGAALVISHTCYAKLGGQLSKPCGRSSTHHTT